MVVEECINKYTGRKEGMNEGWQAEISTFRELSASAHICAYICLIGMLDHRPKTLQSGPAKGKGQCG